MPGSERPCLHPFLQGGRDPTDPRFLILWDRFGFVQQQLRVPIQVFRWLELFDGTRTLPEIQLEAGPLPNGEFIPIEIFTQLVEALDEALFLDGPRLRALFDGRTVREPSCIGCYEGNPEALREQVHDLFVHKKGPGLPHEPAPDGRLRAALIPHIDYHRGGPTFAWGFKEVFEQTDASLFVVIGTSHYSPYRFTLTRKHFKTPLGIAETDQGYIDRLVSHYGDGLFDDEHRAHLPEHSIELEVVFLQYLYEKRKPIRIVPLVVGSFGDCVEEGSNPATKADIGRMVRSLQAVEAETKEPICYIISGDLAHIGPKFGDPQPAVEPWMTESRLQDHQIVRGAETADPWKFYKVIADEMDSRRICGLPPTYVTLAAARPSKGKLLHYDQYVHPRGHESVSFASVAFYR